ncbi:MAG TPA: hypothetical protein VJV05_14495 [Pyrinomonadaceae bacterium]|nr:hypothetical protein [Pyrinomonadaceae bacterium]
MFVAKVYGYLWLVGMAVGTVLYLTDSFDSTSTLFFGYFVSVLAGAGLLVVFPAIVSDRYFAASATTGPNDSRR